METTSIPEPWSTLVLLTLFFLYIMLAGAVSVMSFLPEKSPSSEALRRMSLPIAFLLIYNYGIRLWSMLPGDVMWMAWVFSVITAGSSVVCVLFWKYGLQDAEKSNAEGATSGRGIQAPLLGRPFSTLVASAV